MNGQNVLLLVGGGLMLSSLAAGRNNIQIEEIYTTKSETGKSTSTIVKILTLPAVMGAALLTWLSRPTHPTYGTPQTWVPSLGTVEL
jgi:hypothetical protein